MSAASVDACLARARAAGLSRLDAQLLLGELLARPRAWLLAHGDDAVDTERQAAFAALCARRLAGEPIAYLLGRREFFGLELRITADVLDPRADTETLVEWALALLAAMGPEPTVVDLGTGSGAIALAVRSAWPQARVIAIDASAPALAVARENAARLGLAIDCREGHWLQPLGTQTADLLLGNPPYLAEDDPHLPALAREPRQALVAGADGLADLRHLAAAAPAHLKPGGWLLLEHGADQADAVADSLRRAGFVEIQHRLDLGGHRRCTGGRWRSPA